MSQFFSQSAPEVLELLAHDIRWNVLKALSSSDYRVGELVMLLKKPLNVVSYHLRKLRDGHLVSEHRSSADARDVYYQLDLAALEARYALAAEMLHPGLGKHSTENYMQSEQAIKPVKVLFLCTHNSARSQMAEALLRHLGAERVQVWSAGTEPVTVHPQVYAVLEANQVASDGLRSKHVCEFEQQAFDYVISVCDRAREQCPVLPGHPEQLHWSFADPTGIADTHAQEQAFRELYMQLCIRLRFFLTMLDRSFVDRKGVLC